MIGLSPSTYYYEPKRSRESCEREDASLRDAIEAIQTDFPRAGYRTVQVYLRRRGRFVGERRIRRIMRRFSLHAEIRRAFVRTTDSKHSHRVYPNLLPGRCLTGIDQAWGADLTFIRINNGFVYLAVILDLFSRKVIGWPISKHIDLTQPIADDLQTSNVIEGDKKPLKDGDGNILYDSWGNILPTGNEPNRDDVIYDTPANDLILAGGADDIVNRNHGGDDVVDLGAGDDKLGTLFSAAGRLSAFGGDGRDYLGGGSGRDILQGGDGADGLYGSGDNDLIYGDLAGDANTFITQGATQAGSGLQGEWVDAEDGDDQMFTGAGNDLIAGGAGHDLIVSGGGDDWIAGDWNTIISGTDLWRDWAVTEQVTTDANGNTTYSYNFAYIASQSDLGTGDDTIYAGAGNDVVFGERGHDTIYLEAGNDKAWGDEGNDAIFGGAGNDILHGDNGQNVVDSSLHGSDYLDGGDGDDELFGQGGADTLIARRVRRIILTGDHAARLLRDDYLETPRKAA